MAVNKLKKINVRSPYYISVAPAPDEGGDGSEPDVVVTQPLVLSRDTSCGATEQVGIDVGVRKYNLTTANRQLGDYTITFSNIKVPIKFRIGHSDNMPSFSTAGLDTYAAAWTTATGESPTLSSASANPNGVSATATYTSTQSDIDTYGSTIVLEIQQPLIVEGYSFVSSCPAAVLEQEPTVTGFVTVISIASEPNFGLPINTTATINNVALTQVPSGVGNITRYIFSDETPSLIPKPTTGNLGFINQTAHGAKSFIGSDYNYITQTSYDISVEYVAENRLSRGDNHLKITRGDSSRANYNVAITRHPVVDVNGTNRILGNADGVSIQCISFAEYKPSGRPTVTNVYWNGGNTQEFSNARVESTTIQIRQLPAS